MTTKLDDLGGEVMSSWHRFLDVFEPLRPDLYRYCRHLTRSAWEAEDLAQDTLMRAYVTLGTVFRDLPNPRAWLFRVASNLWIDRVRRARRELAVEREPVGIVDDPRATREAAGTLLVRLSPQERAAVVLRDAFELSIAEVAEALSTTENAVKAALHRGRGKLRDTDDERPLAPAPGALDAFCAAFNARDLPALTALLLDGAIVEIVGLVTEYGREAPADPRTGSFTGTLSPITFDERGGVAAEHTTDYVPSVPRAELRGYRDEWILLFWYDHAGGPAVRTVMRVELEGDAVARVRNYFFSPDVIAEICAELGVPYRANGYRYWP